jgi:hypothetical protein
MVKGSGVGDSVHAMLEPGEFVLNRRAVSAIGAENVAAMNRSVPRFATGGMVGNRGRAAVGGSTLGTGLKAMEIALADAELTPDPNDDIAAATALRNYWRGQASRVRDLFTIKQRTVKGNKGIGDYFGLLPFQWLQQQKFLRTTGKKPLRKSEISRARDKAREAARSQLADALSSQQVYETMLGSGGTGGSTDELLQQQNDLLQQQLQQSQQLYSVSQTQYGVLSQALAAAVSGHIGGKVGLGLQTPSTAGRLATY